jgi:hypothetical protein
MYPYGCDTGSSATVRLLKDGRMIGQASVDDTIGFGYVYERLERGTYEIQVTGLRWARDAVRDYTVSVYAPKRVQITDA